MDQLKQRGENVKVLDFQLDFTRGKFLPKHVFERLVCAVAAKISSSGVENTVNLYRREASFSFDTHYIYAKLHALKIQVHSINYGVCSETTAQYSLRVFLECAIKVVSKDEIYDVLLGYPVKGEPHVKYSSVYSENREVQDIWLNGNSYASTHTHWRSAQSGSKPASENGELILDYESIEFSCEMDDGDFMSCANQLVVDVVPKLMKRLFEELWRIRYKDQQESVKNFTDEKKCGEILAKYGVGEATTSRSHYAIEHESIRRRALSGRLESLDAAAWRHIFLESAHDTKGEGRGLIDEITNAKLQEEIKEGIEHIASICDEICQVQKLKMSLKELGPMVNDFLRCAASVRDYCQYLATPSAVDVAEEQNATAGLVREAGSCQHICVHALLFCRSSHDSTRRQKRCCRSSDTILR